MFNKNVIEIFQNLKDISLQDNNRFKIKAYKKALFILNNLDYQININNYQKIPVLGKKSKDKIKIILETGTYNINKPQTNKFFNELIEITGIGPSKAKSIIKNNITSLEQLKINKLQLLNKKQIIGLKYHPIKKIHRNQIHLFLNYLNQLDIFQKNKNNIFSITGSYRRGKMMCGDVDLLLTNKNNNNQIYKNLVDKLIQDNFILDILAKGTKKFMAFSKITKDGFTCRLDILYTPIKEYPFAKLYFTGSKDFNIKMRNKANKMNLTLNEHGLYNIENNIKKSKIKKTTKIDKIFNTEKDIFKFLNIEYLEPENR